MKTHQAFAKTLCIQSCIGLCIGFLFTPVGAFAQEGDDMYSSGYNTRKVERAATEEPIEEKVAPRTRYRSYTNNTYGEKHTATEVSPEIIERYKRASRDRVRRVIVHDSLRQARAQEAPKHRKRSSRRYYASGYVPHRGWRFGYWDPWYVDPWYGRGAWGPYPYYAYGDPWWGYRGSYRDHRHSHRKHHKNRRYKGEHRAKKKHRSTQRRGRSGRR